MRIMRYLQCGVFVILLSGLSACVPTIIAGSVVGVNSAGSNLPLGTQVDDVTLKGRAYNTLSKVVGGNRKAAVGITTFNGIILLIGQVPTEAIMNKVAQAMTRVKGAKVVYNHLTVQPPLSFSRTANDTWITTKVKSNFVGKVNPFQFKVVTEDGIVYLIAVTDKATGDRAAMIASKTSGVKKVVTCYVYATPMPKPAIKS